MNTESTYLDIKKYFFLFWSYRIFLLTSFIFFGTLSVIYAKSLPNVFTSGIILSPKDSQGFQLNEGVSGLAAAAGINLPENRSQNLVDLSLEVLSSKDFFEVLYSDKDFLKDLIAAKYYDPESQKIIYDPKKYDVEKDELMSFISNGVQYPSFQLSYELFSNKHLKFSKNLKTGFVSISIEHMSPIVARDWLNRIHFELNAYVRGIKTKEANDFKDYLTLELSRNDIPELGLILSGLIKQQIQTLMLAEASDDYVFYIIDSPRAAELKTSPNRATICIVFTSSLILILLMILVILDFYDYRLSPSLKSKRIIVKN